MHYLRTGRGTPPLVFVHGFACSHDDWSFQTEHFRKTHEVVACDLRGHGLTPGRPEECTIENFGGDVAALLINLDLSKSILVGHSMGCRVVLQAAQLAPERVAGLVLIDGSRTGTGDPAAAEAAARAAVDKTGYPAFAEHLFRQMFFQPSALAEAVVVRALRQSAQFGPSLWPAMARWDAATMDAALAAVQAPVLVIQTTTRNAELKRSMLKAGESSPYLDMLHRALKSVRVEVIPGVGHFPQLEAADTVNRLIRDFLIN